VAVGADRIRAMQLGPLPDCHIRDSRRVLLIQRRHVRSALYVWHLSRNRAAVGKALV